MNCQETRKHLYPYLDDELDITQNLAILEHLNACRTCREIFTAEELSWRAVRERLQQDAAPQSLRRRTSASLWAADRRTSYRRVATFLTGAAATLLIVVGISELSGSGDPHPGTGVVRAMHDHGPGIQAAVGAFMQVVRDAQERDVDVMDGAFLEAEDYQVATADRRAQLLGRLCGRDAGLPETALRQTTRVAFRKIELLGQEVTHGMFDSHGQAIGIFRMTREAARLAGLHDLDVGGGRRIELSRCRKCRVIAVTRDREVWILVSRPTTDAALEFARSVF